MLNPIGIKEDRLIHVTNLTESERGSRCNCVCPECGKPLIAKMGEKKIWHFAHKSDTRCDFGLSGSDGESPIHRYAKQIILEEKQVRIDNATLVNFNSIKEEYREKEGETVLDLLGVNENDEELGIEIYYKHKVDLDKIEKLKLRYNNVLEIDIPALIEQDFLDDKTFRKKVIHTYPRKLIINKGYQNNLQYRLDVISQEEVRINQEKAKFLKFIDSKKKFINREEFRLNKKITYVSELKKSVFNLEKQQELKNEELEDLNKNIDNAKKLLNDIEQNKQKLYEETKQILKDKETELNSREVELDTMEYRLNFIKQEEFRLNEKIAQVSDLKETIVNLEKQQELKERELEDLNKKIEDVQKLLKDKQELYEKTKQILKAKEVELNSRETEISLREHRVDRIEKENESLKEEIKEVLKKEINLKYKEEELISLSNNLDTRKEEEEFYYKHKRQALNDRAKELDERGRNLVSINRIKWLKELYSSDFISKEQFENIRTYLKG